MNGRGLGNKVTLAAPHYEPFLWPGLVHIILENEKFFELKRRGYRDGIKRKETR